MKIVESLISRFLKLDFLQLHPKCEQYFMLLIGCLEKLTEEEERNKVEAFNRELVGLLRRKKLVLL